MTRILHITQKTEWEAAQREGSYRPASLQKDGYIHLSQRHQVVSVANAFFAGQKDLVLLEVETELLRPSLRWEAPVGLPLPSNPLDAPQQQLFPHLYGPLNLDAVVAVHEFSPEADGHFILPPEFTPGG